MPLYSSAHSNELMKICESIISKSQLEPEWVTSYLLKQRLLLPDMFFSQEQTITAPSLPIRLAELFTHQKWTLSDIQHLDQKMNLAFRVKKHRKSKELVNFSVSLEKSVYKQLSDMSGKNKRNKVITALIQQNFQSLLIQEQHTKIRVEEEKNKKALATLQNQLKQLNLASAFKALQSASQTVPTDSLLNGITQLYEIIQSSYKTGAAIDALALLKATEIYTAALRNASEEASNKKLAPSE